MPLYTISAPFCRALSACTLSLQVCLLVAWQHGAPHLGPSGAPLPVFTCMQPRCRLGVHGQGGAAPQLLLPRRRQGQFVQAPPGALLLGPQNPVNHHQYTARKGCENAASGHSCQPCGSGVDTCEIAAGCLCTCPSMRLHKPHAAAQFIMLRVLRLPQDDPVVWQRALLKSEVRSVASSSAASRQLQTAFHVEMQYANLAAAVCLAELCRVIACAARSGQPQRARLGCADSPCSKLQDSKFHYLICRAAGGGGDGGQPQHARSDVQIELPCSKVQVLVCS